MKKTGSELIGTNRWRVTNENHVERRSCDCSWFNSGVAYPERLGGELMNGIDVVLALVSSVIGTLLGIAIALVIVNIVL